VPSSPPRGQGKLLLVVEDDASVQHLLRSLLLTYNYNILFASNGFEPSTATPSTGSRCRGSDFLLKPYDLSDLLRTIVILMYQT
jgi:DNA-binding NtrC family response regulator